MADFCTECGRELSRFKTNKGHMDNCPTLYENQPSVGRGRKPKTHTAEWKKTGRMNVEETMMNLWSCKVCGKQGMTSTDSDPGPAEHRGAK